MRWLRALLSSRASFVAGSALGVSLHLDCVVMVARRFAASLLCTLGLRLRFQPHLLLLMIFTKVV